MGAHTDKFEKKKKIVIVSTNATKWTIIIVFIIDTEA